MNLFQRAFAPTLLLFLAGCAGGGIAAPNTGHAQPPLKRQAVMNMVLDEATNINISPSLALAVAHTESSFNPRALSKAGARGVMQIMPLTARTEYGINAEQLWNPQINIRLGLHFLRRLIDRYGRVDIALSHYNGGSAVGRPGRARVIPATRPYVARVRRLDIHYRRWLRQRQVAAFTQFQFATID